MDGSAPIPLEYDCPPPTRPARPLALVGIAVAAILAGTLMGASTNAVNGAVSPTYFINVMGWQYVSNVWLASILQGVYARGLQGNAASENALTLGAMVKTSAERAWGLVDVPRP